MQVEKPTTVSWFGLHILHRNITITTTEMKNFICGREWKKKLKKLHLELQSGINFSQKVELFSISTTFLRVLLKK